MPMEIVLISQQSCCTQHGIQLKTQQPVLLLTACTCTMLKDGPRRNVFSWLAFLGCCWRRLSIPFPPTSQLEATLILTFTVPFEPVAHGLRHLKVQKWLSQKPQGSNLILYPGWRHLIFLPPPNRPNFLSSSFAFPCIFLQREDAA